MGANKQNTAVVDYSGSPGWAAKKMLRGNGTWVDAALTTRMVYACVTSGTTLALGATGSRTNPFSTVVEAITAAVALTPSATNPVEVVLMDGTYVESPTIGNAYISIRTATRGELLYSGVSWAVINTSSVGVLRPVWINGTVTVSVDNVSISGINCNTLALTNAGLNSKFSNIVAGTAITCNTTNTGTFYDVHSALFLGAGVAMGGYYEKCTTGAGGFASATAGAGGNITGKMVDCIGLSNTFASSSNNGSAAGTISGTLVNCSATTGSFSSATGTTGNGGDISGFLTGCVATTTSYGYSLGSTAGSITSAAILRNCSGTSLCFSSGTVTGNAIAGKMYNCIATSDSYSYGGTTAGNITGYLMNCIGTTGCYSSSATGTVGTISGKMTSCSSAGYSFASCAGSNGGTISGVLIDCESTGNMTFASCEGAFTGGTISGILINCRNLDGTASFASVLHTGANGTGGTISGKLVNCIGYNATFASAYTGLNNTGLGGTISGTMTNCEARGLSSFASSHGSNTAGNCTGGTISGTLVNCRAVLDVTAFASGRAGGVGTSTGGTISGTLDNIAMVQGATCLMNATITGVLKNSRIDGTGNGLGYAIKVATGARIRTCDLKATTDAINAAAAATVSVTHCNLYGVGVHANVTLVETTIAGGFNTDIADTF